VVAALKELTEEEEAVSVDVLACARPDEARKMLSIPLLWRAQDLLQYKDRDRWYLPTFHANDAPDWNAGAFLRSRQLAPGIREVRRDMQTPC
jgi:hypothetical protein